MNERRAHLRFDKVFTVYLTTPDGMTRGIGRNISVRGLFVETREPLPLGGAAEGDVRGRRRHGDDVPVRGALPGGALRTAGRTGARATAAGVGLRIVAYETQDDAPLLLVDRERVMH